MGTKEIVLAALGLGCVGLVLPACGAKRPILDVSRTATTGLKPGDAVSVILRQYDTYSEPDAEYCWTGARPHPKEKDFEGCVGRALGKLPTDVRVVPARTFRRTAFPGDPGPPCSADLASFVSALSDPVLAGRLEPLGLRYLVVLEVSTRKDDRKPIAEAQDLVWFIGREWVRVSTVKASVVDMRRRSQAGVITADSSGSAGFALPVLLIIPLPPIGWSASTETKSCEALGEAVASFLEDVDGEEDAGALPRPDQPDPGSSPAPAPGGGASDPRSSTARSHAGVVAGAPPL